MALHKHKFSYTPQYNDLVYMGIFILGLGTILLLPHPLFIPLLWVIVISGTYLFITKKPKIFFYEETIEIINGFGKSKSTSVVSYSNVRNIEYCFSEMGRGNLFKIFFLLSDKTHSIQYTFMGNPTQFEIAFFEGKGITIKVSPESARYKLHPPAK